VSGRNETCLFNETNLLQDKLWQNKIEQSVLQQDMLKFDALSAWLRDFYNKTFGIAV
jgi:hypothetical protein